MSDTTIPLFVINLRIDESRREIMAEQMSVLSGFAPSFVTGCDGRELAHNVCAALAHDLRWAQLKGTIGCFISHVKAWEAVVASSAPFGIILEDDVDLKQLPRLSHFNIPNDAGIVFLNDRMSPCHPDDKPEVLPLWHALLRIDKTRSGAGGDGYLLTRSAASAMLDACTRDFYFGHVDGRILRYATSETDLAELSPDSWIASVIRHHHHQSLAPMLGLVKGYCLSYPLIWHRGIQSSREALDRVIT